MEELIAYIENFRIEDFIMFSPSIYQSTVKLYNQGIWPLQILILMVNVALVILSFRPQWHPRRFQFGQMISAYLACVWLFIGFSFHAHYHATINWPAKYFSFAFMLQGIAFAGLVLFRSRSQVGTQSLYRRIGVSLIGFSMLGFPVINALIFSPKEILGFGWGPFETLLGTLGYFIALGHRYSLLLLIPAILWGIAHCLQVYALGSVDRYWVIPLTIASILALVFQGLCKQKSSPSFHD